MSYTWIQIKSSDNNDNNFFAIVREKQRSWSVYVNFYWSNIDQIVIWNLKNKSVFAIIIVCVDPHTILFIASTTIIIISSTTLAWKIDEVIKLCFPFIVYDDQNNEWTVWRHCWSNAIMNMFTNRHVVCVIRFLNRLLQVDFTSTTTQKDTIRHRKSH